MSVFAQIPNDTFAALWIAGRAGIASVQYEPMMSVLLEFGVHNPLQLVLHLTNRLSRCQGSTVGYPENVRIDGDRRLAESSIEDYVRGLSANPGKRLQGFSVGGYLPIVLFEQHGAGLDDIARFGIEKSDAFYIRLEALFAEIADRLR